MIFLLLLSLVAGIDFEELSSIPTGCNIVYDLQSFGGTVSISCAGVSSKFIAFFDVSTDGVITGGGQYPSTQKVGIRFKSEDVAYVLEHASESLVSIDLTNVTTPVVGTSFSIGGEGLSLAVGSSSNIFISNSSGVRHIIPSSPTSFSTLSYNQFYQTDFAVLQVIPTESKAFLYNNTNFFRIYSYDTPGTQQFDTSRMLSVNRVVGDALRVQPVRFAYESTWKSYFTLELGVVYRWSSANNVINVDKTGTFIGLCLLEEMKILIVSTDSLMTAMGYNETHIWTAATYGNVTSVQHLHCGGSGNMIYYVDRLKGEVASLRLGAAPLPASETEAPPRVQLTQAPDTETPPSLPTITEVSTDQLLGYKDIPEETKTATGVSSVVGAVSAFTGPSAGVTIVRGVTLARGLLCSEEDEKLPVIMHPTVFAIDSSYWAGAVVGNVSICAGAMLIFWLLTNVVSVPTLRYPSRLAPLYQLLFPSTFECALHLLFNTKLVYIAVIGVLSTIIFCLYTWVYGRADHSKCELLSQVDVDQKNPITRYFVGTAVWTSREKDYVEKYGVVFEGFRYFPILKGHYFLIEFAHVIIISFFSALSWFSKTGCLFKTGGISVTMIIQTLIVIFYPVYIAPFLNHLTILTCLVMCTSCVLAFVSFVVYGVMEGNLGVASLQLLTASFWLATVRGIYDIILFVVDIVFGYTRGISPETIKSPSMAPSLSASFKDLTADPFSLHHMQPINPELDQDCLGRGVNRELDNDPHGRGYYSL